MITLVKDSSRAASLLSSARKDPSRARSFLGRKLKTSNEDQAAEEDGAGSRRRIGDWFRRKVTDLSIPEVNDVPETADYIPLDVPMELEGDVR